VGAPVRNVVGFVVSSVFVALGLFMALEEPAQGALTTLFFGLCAAVFVWSGVQQRRTAAALADTESIARLPGRVESSRGLRWVVALGLVASGVALPLGVEGQGALALGALIGAVGAAATVATAAGWNRRVLVAQPDGLWIEERRYRFRVPWDGLAVSVFELNGNPVVGLQPARLDAVLASVDPPSARDAVARALGSTLAWTQVPILLTPFRYGLSAGHLAKALARYASDPAARAEL
jgi:hypothetical protein